MTREQVKAVIDALVVLRDEVSDDQASKVAALYPTLKQNGVLVTAGTRINWNGQLKKAATDLWDTAENNPDNAPTLWADLVYQGEYRTIPETVTVTTAFAKGEKGWWNGVLYESLIDANVYNPDQYPAGWVQCEN